MTWVDICPQNDIGEGQMHPFEHGEQWLVLYNLQGEFFVTDNVCPHAFALLSDGYLEDGKIECPLHGALFDVRTGAVEMGPATCGIKTYPVQIENGVVQAQLHG